MAHKEQANHAKPTPDNEQIDTSNYDLSSGKKSRPWAALWSVSAGFFMIMLDTTIVGVAQPQLQAGLHTSLNAVIWASTAYMVAYAVPMLFTGRLGDQCGPRIVYVSGLIVFTFASACCGLASGISMLITARVLEGLGAALMGPQTLAVVNKLFTGSARGPAMAVWSAIQGSATLLGPIIGGVFVALLDWRWIFFVNIPIGLISIICALRFIPRFSGNNHKFDVIGIALSTVGLAMLVLTIQQGTAMSTPTLWTLLAGAVVILVLFIRSQRNRSEPLVPLTLFNGRDFSLSIAALILSSLAVNAQLIPVMYYLQRVIGMSALTAALTSISMPAATVVLARFVGKAISKFHPTAILLPAFFLAAIGASILQMAMAPDRSTLLVTIGYGIFGIGVAFIWPPLATYSLRGVPPTEHGAASGIFNTMRIVGGVIGMAIMSAVIEFRLRLIGNSIDITEGSTSTVIPPGEYRANYLSALATASWLPVAAFTIGAILCVGYAIGSPHSRTTNV